MQEVRALTKESLKLAFLQKDAPIPLKGKGTKMTHRMERFVDEYMVDLNASQALVRAGYNYSEKNRHKMAQKVKNHPLVTRAINERIQERHEAVTLSAEKAELTADYVIDKLMAIVASNEEENPNAALRGLELLGKNLGLFKDRQEISGPDGGAIEMKQKTEQDVAEFRSKLARIANRSGKGDVVSFPQ